MQDTPSFCNDLFVAALTYSGSPLMIEVVPKLGSDENLITLASALAPFSNQFFVVIVAISGVPKRAPAFVGSIEHLRGRGIRCRFQV